MIRGFPSVVSRPLWWLVALFTALAPIRAEAPFAFATTPGKLPKDVVPEHYTLRLQPDLATLTFTGTARIDLQVHGADKTSLQLNALDLTIASASLVTPSADGEAAATPLAVATDADPQLLTLTPPAPLPAGAHTIELTYSGVIYPQAQGFFFDEYPTRDGPRRMFGTQMEPTDARRVFPGWDEPAFRATYDITVVVPVAFTAVGNMPAIHEEPLPDGRKAVTFARTPAMPSYLVALFGGEFEAVAGEHAGIALRILTTAGKSAQTRYALDASKAVLAYYDEYFGLPYPLPKLDQIGVPNAFSGFGAMENWGAISYIDTLLLYDPAASSQNVKEEVFLTVAHELAHQWFGNLVTMAWWDNLWLNEGFASWMESKVTADLNPAWDHWLRAGTSKDSVMGLDARASTHAIQQVVATEAEAAAGFNEITYDKGKAFIRMLEDYIGEDAFRAGIRLYLQRHRLSNTTSADLWAALSEASGLDIGPLAMSWTLQPGFPLVELELGGTADAPVLIATQSRFRLDATADATPSPVWQIPLTFAPLAAPDDITRVLLTAPRTEIPLPAGFGPLKANHADIGYYRVSYAPDLRPALVAAIAALPTADQLNLFSDTWALSQAGRLPATESLELIAALRDETDPTLLNRLVDTLITLDRYQRDQPGRAAFRAWAIDLVRPWFDRLGWTPRDDESDLDGALRGTLVQALGAWGDPAIIAGAHQRFEAFLRDPASVPADLVPPVLDTVGRYADAATYAQLLRLARDALGTELKTGAYDAAWRSLDPALARRSLELALDPATPVAIANYIPYQIAHYGEHPDLAWSFVTERFDALVERVTAMERYTYASSLASASSRRDRADELIAFYAMHLPPDAAPLAARAAEGLRAKVDVIERELPGIDTWISARPAKQPE